MPQTSANILCYGEDRPLPGEPSTRPDPTDLSVGPFAVTYAAGDLRYLRAGGVELLRRVYAAVRDRNWGTIPAELSDVRVRHDEPDGFHVTYTARHRGRDADGEIDFEWSADVRGEASEGGGRRVTFTMDGVARTGFLTNRIGLCVLHPIRHCAGRPCAVEHTDGSIEHGAFPDLVAPRQPFKDVRAITHEPVPGVRVEVRFDGDVFETEDQRNWTDGSFKTYSRPLARPFPYRVEAGERVRQTVTVTVTGDVSEQPAGPAWTLAVEDRPVGRVPQIGLQLGPSRSRLTRAEMARLAALRPAHLRVNLSFASDAAYLHHGIDVADHLGARVEIAVQLHPAESDEDLRVMAAALEDVLDRSFESWAAGRRGDEETQLRRLADTVAASPSDRIGRWLILHAQENVTAPQWVALARRILGEVTPGVPVGGGTRFDFVELNRNRPPAEAVDFLSFAVSPQVHATDDLSIMENLEGQAEVVRTARAFAPGVPLSVGPVTLKRGGNPAATGPSAEPMPDELPADVDPRQAGLVGAAWALGSLKYLAEAGVDFVTYYETVGWRGVMETEAGPRLPDKFRSPPGGVYPLYHVFADVGEFAGGEVLASACGDGNRVTTLALRQGARMRVLVANLTYETTIVSFPHEPPGWRLDGATELSVENAATAMRDPERFRDRAPMRASASGGAFEFLLSEYGILRLDLERVSDEQR